MTGADEGMKGRPLLQSVEHTTTPKHLERDELAAPRSVLLIFSDRQVWRTGPECATSHLPAVSAAKRLRILYRVGPVRVMAPVLTTERR